MRYVPFRIAALAALCLVAGTAATMLAGRRGGAGPEDPDHGSCPLEVTVVSAATRAPVAGARVRVHLPSSVPVSASTGADGVARFRGLPAAFLLVEAVHADHADASSRVDTRSPVGWRLTLHLRPPVPVAGSVLADADGSPVEGATVRIRRNDGPLLETRTGPDGGFRFGSGGETAPGTLGEVEAAGFETQTFSLPSATAGPAGIRFDVRLRRGARIRGRVLDGDGRPVAGARVFLHSGRPSPGALFRRDGAPAAPWSPFSRPGPEFWTGGDGAFRFEGIARGAACTLTAGAPPPPGRTWYGGEPRARPRTVEVGDDADEEIVDLVLARPGLLYVRWPGAVSPRIFLLDPGDPVAPRLPPAYTVDGGWGFGYVDPGRYLVRGESPAGLAAADAVVLPGETTEVFLETIAGPVEGVPSLAGAVVDVQGGGIPGAQVRLFRLLREGGSDRVWQPTVSHQHTGSRGEFRFLVPQASAELWLDARAPGFEPGLAGPFRGGQEGLLVPLHRRGRVTGRVVLPTGETAPSSLSIHFEGDGPEKAPVALREPTLRVTVPFGDGRFAVEEIPPGAGRLWGRAGERLFGPVPLNVPEGGTVAVELRAAE